MSTSRPATTIQIGNAAGFWGDHLDAPRQLAAVHALDYLTLEYLAELTLSILAHQRAKQPDAGFVTDVPDVIRSIADRFRDNVSTARPLRLVTNGGGMNPIACAQACSRELCELGMGHVKIAAVAGDDLLPRLDELIAAGHDFPHFDRGVALGSLRNRIASANVYMGAKGIVQALAEEARIVLTGRIADASLVLGPALYEFGWDWSDWHRLGAATVAGHLIECGAQVTGGMYADWTPRIDVGRIGYPIAELDSDGTCVITKPPGTSGEVSVGTVAEQLVYEIGDPARYMTPDVVADFTQVQLQSIGVDRVRVTGGTGTSRPDQWKVSMSYYDGFTTSAMIVVTGKHARQKGEACGVAIQTKLAAAGFTLDELTWECLGAGDTLPGMDLWRSEPYEIVLRVAGRDSRREAIERLTREVAPLVTSGPPGVTGYTGSRARPRPVISYWPTTIDRQVVTPEVIVRTAQQWCKAT